MKTLFQDENKILKLWLKKHSKKENIIRECKEEIKPIVYGEIKPIIPIQPIPFQSYNRPKRKKKKLVENELNDFILIQNRTKYNDRIILRRIQSLLSNNARVEIFEYRNILVKTDIIRLKLVWKILRDARLVGPSVLLGID